MSRGIRRVEVAVPRDECKRRALRYLYGRTDLINASSVAYAIWPEAQFTAQGAGAAASRILKLLIDDGLARWNSHGWPRAWGYEITDAGRAKVRNAGDSSAPASDRRAAPTLKGGGKG